MSREQGAMSKGKRNKGMDGAMIIYIEEISMIVNGCDCSIVIKTSHLERDIPYSDETIREAVSLLEEEAAIEGGVICKAILRPR
jgi:hypothetical protein